MANGSAANDKKKRKSGSAGDALIDLIFVLLSFVPHLLKGAKWATITMIALFVAGKLFPSVFATLLSFM